MSTRTIIEINHDHLARMISDPEHLLALLRRLGNSHYNADLNEANTRERSLNIGWGLQIVLQRHHTTSVAVKTEYQTVKL